LVASTSACSGRFSPSEATPALLLDLLDFCLGCFVEQLYAPSKVGLRRVGVSHGAAPEIARQLS
jgi:hypothetical protein